MSTLESLHPLIFKYTIQIPKDITPYIWKRWNDLSTWNEWDTGLEKTIFPDNKLAFGKTFHVLPKGNQSPVQVYVSSFIEGIHFTTTSHNVVGTFSIGHSILDEKSSKENFIEHTVCVCPNDYQFFLDNIWDRFKENIIDSVNNLVEIANNE